MTYIQQGENAQIEFKSAQVRPDSVAREIVAFANTLGGTLLIGALFKIWSVSCRMSLSVACVEVRNTGLSCIKPRVSFLNAGYLALLIKGRNPYH